MKIIVICGGNSSEKEISVKSGTSVFSSIKKQYNSELLLLSNNYRIIKDCLRIKKSPVHFNLEEALYIHKELKPKKTFLTNLHNDLDYDYLLKSLPKNILPAYDGLKLNL